MHWKSGVTSWKDPNTNLFVTRKEYGRLGKRTAVNKMSIPNYLFSLGYFQDKYYYYRLKDKMFLKKEENKVGYSIYKINFDDQKHTVLYDSIETIEEADLLAQLAMSNKYYTNDLIFINAGWNRDIKSSPELYNRALELAEEYKSERR